jgi:Mrp family chromosome partitioning ATPase
VFEAAPAFEEDARQAPSPGPVARAVLDGGSPQGRDLRQLAARLRALGRDKRLRRIGVVGASAGEGASTVALGLASALAADRGVRVLLLELDLRRPSLDRALGVSPPEVGLGEFLDGRGETPVLRRPTGGFWLLSAGAAAGSRALSPARLGSLFRATDRVFDLVVADCPPLLEREMPPFLQDVLDGFVFVVRARHAPREAIRRAAALLRRGRITGLVLNARRDAFRRPRAR